LIAGFSWRAIIKFALRPLRMREKPNGFVVGGLLLVLFVAALTDAATRRYPRSGGFSISLRPKS
jgi:hypothetical protein